MKHWNYYKPEFECDTINKELLVYSPWSGHRNFAYDYIEFVQPKTIVELGSHYGCSTFAFLQALKDFNIDSKFVAIDTWCGDDFTKNDYENDIYSEFMNTYNTYYSSVNLNAIRKTFDNAVNEFQNESIDLLHIDGSHNYEDVKHDFELWNEKVKNNGVIFFHDISEDKVFGETMGSCVYWNEIKKDYPYTMEFDFSYGLGILFKSKEMYEKLVREIDIAKYQRISNEAAVNCNATVRESYFIIKGNRYHIESLKEQLNIKDEHLERYRINSEAKAKYISELEKSNADLRAMIEVYTAQMNSDLDKQEDLESGE